MRGENYDVKDVTFVGITVVCTSSLTSQRLVRKNPNCWIFFLPILGRVREFPYGTIKDGIQVSSDDWEANRRGWRGAKSGKSLLESCSRNPRDYYK